jgi:hypothetical protein
MKFKDDDIIDEDQHIQIQQRIHEKRQKRVE